MTKRSELYERGHKARTEVLGRDYVERSHANATPFNADYQTYTTEHVWGAVWTRPGLERKHRSMVTIAILAALGREEELKLHLRATRNTGLGRDEVKEVFLHVAAYAGVPAANSAFRIARQVYDEADGGGAQTGALGAPR
jgi:4-carboxymuconolactone decarboxylase